MQNTEHPRVFVSYSWSSQEYQDRVLTFAKRLMENGVDVVLDKWDLKEGQDKHAFMEKMVNDKTIDRVLVCCDGKYRAKANSRIGGVGTESTIISEKVYSDVDQTKFIPIVFERVDGEAALPTFMASRIYFDLSQDDPMEFTRLIRTLWEAPLFEKPSLGKMPVFKKEGKQQYKIIAIDQTVGLKDSINNFTAILEEKIKTLEILPPGAESKESLEAHLELANAFRSEIVDFVIRIINSDLQNQIKIESIRDIYSVICSEINTSRPGSNYTHGKDFILYLCRSLSIEIVADLLTKKNYELCGKFLILKIPVTGNNSQIVMPVRYGHAIEFIDKTLNKLTNSNKISYSTDKYLTAPRVTSAKKIDVINADLVLFVSSVINIDDGYHWVPYTVLYNDNHCNITKLFLTINAETNSHISLALWGNPKFSELLEAISRYSKELKYPLLPSSSGMASPISMISLRK